MCVWVASLSSTLTVFFSFHFFLFWEKKNRCKLYFMCVDEMRVVESFFFPVFIQQVRRILGCSGQILSRVQRDKNTNKLQY